ncbi:MAG: DUF2141 domain-containing protein [Gemmatimonadetes bacterium]|nr:DUF2141 domain-containing protein [Gemmatimonadota bacterium]MYG84561.1 DUF2141 domain-containing protein [Gemmatimonadota bacterium]MYJ91310.1 DUF2141 domain-containing protein [Gemmatimonadota bacterium]
MYKLLYATAVSCCICAAAVGAMATPATGGDLEITVEGISDDEGNVMVALHDESGMEGFPGANGAIAAQWMRAAPGSLRFVFLDLSPGRYAVAVFHDDNGNDELDTNILGIPSEGTGFSRNAQGNFGPPSFHDAAVEISSDSGTTHTTATLVY